MEKETLEEAKHNCEGCQGKGYLDKTDGYYFGKAVCPVCVNDKEPKQEHFQEMNDFMFMKKETLEEAAEHNYPGGDVWTEEQAIIRRLAFKNGAKWQAEKIGLMEIELNNTKTLLESCEKALENRDKKAERMYSDLSELRNDLYDKLPIDDVDAFEILKVIKNHLQKLDALCGNK